MVIPRYVSGVALAILVVMVLLATSNFGTPATSCTGPSVIADVTPSQININQTVTVSGEIYPVNQNATVQVTFVRPDLSYLDLYTTENATGQFNVTLALDSYGFWTVYVIHDAINDRFSVNVVSPPNVSPPPVAYALSVPSPSPSIVVVGAFLVLIIVGALAVGKIVRNKKIKVTSARVFVQIGSLFFIFLGVFVNYNGVPFLPFATLSGHDFLIGANLPGISPDGISVPTFGCYYGCGRTVTCALWQIQAYIFPFWNAGHGWGVQYVLPGIERLAIVFGLVALMSIILGRIFCGWVCPFGLYVDFISWVRKTFKIKHQNLSEKTNEKVRQLRYVIIAGILIVCFILGSQAITGTLIIPSTQPGEYAYTYFSQPFCQVCPMKPLCVMLLTLLGPMKPAQIFSTTTGQFLQLGYYVTSLNLIVLGIVTVTAFIFRRLWCRICPLGGLIAVFSTFPPFKYVSVTRLEKTETKCTKCGLCRRVCPTQVTKVYKEKGGNVTDSGCIMCLRCVEMCPEKGCLKVNVAGKTAFESRNWLE